MSLATLFNAPHGEAGLDFFTIANEAEHNEVGQAIFKQMKIYIPPLLLRPLFPADQGGWLIRHATLHTRINEILKVGGNDLTSVDLQDRANLEHWVWLHAQEHRQWRVTLEI